jgi:uncharacterized protein YkwD
MSATELEAAVGRPSAEEAISPQKVLRFDPLGLTVWLEGGRTVQVRTTNPGHATASGFGPGQPNWEAARAALCQGLSARYDVPGGMEIRCPSAGLIIEVWANRIASMSVIPAEASGRQGSTPSESRTGPASPPGMQSLPALPRAENVSGSDDPGVIQLVNTARAVGRTCGEIAYRAVPPVAWSDRLAYAAQWHALDMAIHDYVEHVGSDGSSPGDRLARVGYQWLAYGENVAGGFRTAEEIMTGWLRSPGHCANIMGREYSEAGAAWARGTGRYKIYWVLVMAGRQ